MSSEAYDADVAQQGLKSHALLLHADDKDATLRALRAIRNLKSNSPQEWTEVCALLGRSLSKADRATRRASGTQLERASATAAAIAEIVSLFNNADELLAKLEKPPAPGRDPRRLNGRRP